MRNIIVFLVLLTAIFVIVSPFSMERSDIWGRTRYYSLSTQLRQFSSYEELVRYLRVEPQISPYYRGMLERSSTLSSSTFESDSSLKAMYGLGEPIPEYSTTNVQVEGVDEGDLVKTDGEFIYVVSGQSVIILKAFPAEEAEALSQIRLNGTLKDIFINGGKLAAFEESDSKTFIRVYNVTDRRSPTSTMNVSSDGYYFNSRMIGEYVYAVINSPARLTKGEVALPKIYTTDKVDEIPASDIYYADTPDYSYTFTTVIAVNIQKDEEPSHETFMFGNTRLMYASLNNIYIALREHERTLVYRLHIDGNTIECSASGEVPGYVLNQFSMDEFGDYFRIATTTGLGTDKNHVYVLDMSLKTVGRLEGLAPREEIYSTRFMGNRCYLVTFRQVDPFFVVDLSDPTMPKLLGELKIPGFSKYLHLYDENHIIGIGKQGSNVKMSLFNVVDVTAPIEEANFIVGTTSNSPVLDDHKAFLFSKSKQLLALPVSMDTFVVEGGRYTWHRWQGAYVFNITLEEGFVLRGNVTHQENSTAYEYHLHVKRILYIDNVLCTISDKKVKMNDLESLEEIKEIRLSP